MDNKSLWTGWDTVRMIGRGSYGAVYEIEREVFGHREKAALKVITIPQNESDIEELLGEGYDEVSITTRFESYLHDIVREYSMMADMKGCANIVYCDDVRYIQHDDGMGWDIFIKMELLTALPKALGKNITEEQAVRIGTDICSALAFCEKRNLLHRDIKPQNIFVAPDGTYKLGDFGIAKTAERTTSGTKTGTYKYMAPEVYNNQPYGGKADIYSLGLVLYWLLNERRTPFLPLPPTAPKAAEEDQARARRFNGEAIPAPAHGSKELQRIVLKACAYDPKDRYQSAEEMLRDLERLNQSAEAAVNRPFPSQESEEDSETVGAFETALPTARPIPRPASQESEEEGGTVDAFGTVWSTTQSIPRTASQEAEEDGCNTSTASRNNKPAPKTPVPRPEPEPTPSRPLKAKKKKGLIVAALAAVLVIGIVLLFLLLHGGDDDSSQEASEETAESSAVETPGAAEETADTKTEETITVKYVSLNPGETVFYGAYEQDGNDANGKEPVEWIVLDQDGEYALLLSRFVLDSKLYNENGGTSSWSECSLRAWMNGQMLDELFDQELQSAIRTTDVPDEGNSKYGIRAGKTTQDKLFLLSRSEVEKYFPTEGERKVCTTYYAKMNGAKELGNNLCCWWALRSTGKSSAYIDHVWLDGRIDPDAETDYEAGGIRPAMWVKMPFGIKEYSTTIQDLMWEIDQDGVLSIQGEGRMPDYNDPASSPWYALRENIKTVRIPEGITYIGNRAFYGCENLRSAAIPKSVTGIGTQAFSGCTSLEDLSLPQGVAIGYDALPVVGLPKVQYYPNSVIAKAGERICIPVLATGAESYQWYCRKPGDSTWTEVPNTAGEGSVCLVRAKTGNNGYQYYCVISNGSGTVETEPITLTVIS